MRLRRSAATVAVAAAAVAAVPGLAHAQFAGVLAAPPRRPDAPLLTPTQVRAQRDSSRQEAMSDMRAWVDSAAGIVTVTPRPPDAPGRDPTSRPDSVRPPIVPARDSTARPDSARGPGADPARPPRR